MDSNIFFLCSVLVSVSGSVLLAAPAPQPTEGYLERFSRRMSAPERARVPLRVDFPRGSQISRYPVTFGVPFPRGALASERNVRLLQGDREVPADIRCTATWERPNGSVKWLLIDAAVAPGKSYALEYGTQVSRSAVAGPLRVTDSGDAVTVATGRLIFQVSRTQPGLLHGAWLDRNGDGRPASAEVVVAPGTNPAPFIVDDRGEIYPLAASDGYQVKVEQSGPLHAIVKVEGWYRSAQGMPFCQHIARLHAYAGESFLRVEHTFVVGFDTDAYRIRDIALPFHLSALAIRGATFGLDGETNRSVDGSAYLIQDAAQHFALKRADGAVLSSGGRAAGWVDVRAGGVALTLGVRHFWQEYPRELEVRDAEVIAHLWPPHGERLLDFDAKAVLGPERYQAWNRVYWQQWYEGGLDQYDQAYGLAKSNDLLLVFHDSSEKPASDLCHTLDEPVIVAASPEWMCRSDVMGAIHPRDRERFPEEERKMDAGFFRFEWLREHLGNYGMIDYGDVNYHLTWDEAAKRWQPSPWRCWASRFYGHPVMPWVQFLRTGERRFLQWGIDNARHVMDIDMCHLTKTDIGRFPKYRGGRYGGNGGILHYAADIYDIGCDSHVEHLLLQYYLTGYRRAWDVLQEEAEFYLWKDTQPGGTLHRWGHRMTGGALLVMTLLYEATWDERYLTIARRLADHCYQNQDEAGVIRHDDVYMMPGLFRYYQATGDERMRELILRCMRYQAANGRDESDPRSFGFYGLSTAYLLTGDPSYLRWAERWRRDFVQCVTESSDPQEHGRPVGQWDYCYLTLHLLYLPYYLEALSTLSAPVAPAAAENAITNGEILICRKDRKPFHLSAEWICYSPRHTIGVSVPRLGEYLKRHPCRARLVLRAPDGAVAAAQPITMGGETRTGKVPLDVPEGPPGIYRLAVEETGGLPFKLRLASCDVAERGFATESGYVSGADTYYFYVPSNVSRFEMAFKALALRRAVDFSIRDPAGQMRQRTRVEYGSSPPEAYTTWPIEAEPEHRGKWWSFTIGPMASRVEQVHLRLRGVPPIVWTTPEAFFSPDVGALTPRAKAEPAAYPGAGKALRVEAGKPFVVPRGQKVAEGRYERIDSQRGTLEFWFRPEWARDDLRDYPIASCGQMRLLRRSQIGTYVSLGGTVQSGFSTEAGYWYHLAVTWDAGGVGRRPQTRLFINGVELTGTVLSPAEAPLGDWTGETLTIGGAFPCSIGDVRISDTIRYEGDFDPTALGPPDEHTLFHGLF